MINDTAVFRCDFYLDGEYHRTDYYPAYDEEDAYRQADEIATLTYELYSVRVDIKEVLDFGKEFKRNETYATRKKIKNNLK